MRGSGWLWRASALVTAGVLLLSGGAAAAWSSPVSEVPGVADPTAESRVSAEQSPEAPTTAPESEANEADPSAPETAPPSDSAKPHTSEAPADEQAEQKTAPRAVDGASGLSIELTQEDGTPQWNWQDDSTANGVIRTNDLITYSVHLTANGLQEDTVVTLDLPQGAILNQIPGFCDPGSSSLTPAAKDIPEPQVPSTADSWKEIPQQTLVCVLGDLASEDAGLDTKFDVTVKVRSEVPDGTELPAVASVTTAEQTEPLTSNEVSATVSAAPQYDISKNAYVELPNDGSDANNGPIGITDSPRACSFDSSKRCQVIGYPLWISVPSGGKGNEPATGFSFVDDLSPEAFYGAGITSSPAWRPEYAPRLMNVVWGDPQGVGSGIDAGWGRSADDSVRNSGSWDIQNDNGVYTITLMDGDYTAWTYPNQKQDGTPLPDQQQAGVVSLGLQVEVPWEAITALGEDTGNGTTQLGTTNRYTDFSVTSVSGQENSEGAEEPRNNTRTQVLTARTGGPGWQVLKRFWNIYGPSANDPAAWDFLGNLPGSSGSGTGDAPVAAGQVVQSRVTVSNLNDPSVAEPDRIAVACDYWDPAQFTLAPGDYEAGPGIFDPNKSEGAAVWLLDNGPSGTTPPTMSNIQYGVLDFVPDSSIAGGVSPTVAAGCEDARITWYDSVAAAGGVEKVGAVRAKLTIHRDLINVNTATMGVALRATDAPREANTVMPNYANAVSLSVADGADASVAEVLEAGEVSAASGYVGDTHVGPRGDRVLAGELYASINKQIQDPVDEHWTDDLQAFSGGQRATFRLIPSLSSTAPLATSKQVVVEDCIPKGFALDSSNRDYTTIRPADANLACKSGETYVRWDLGEVSVQDTMDEHFLPIEYTVVVSKLLKPGTYENVAQVTAEGDPAALDPSKYKRVTDKQQILVQSLRGVFLEKASLTPVTQINLAGQGANELTSWEVRVGNMETEGPRDMDVIDRLPVQTGTTGNDFDGAMSFVGAEITDYGATDPDQTRSTLYYTTADSFDLDPRAASNTNADGSVTAIWSATRPSGPATVTGVRLVRTGDFAPGEQLAFRIDMAGVANREGDTYRNNVQAVAHQGLGGLLVAAGNSRAVESTIGDFVWFDTNGNGLQDSGEAGVPNATVKLVGVDDLGNPVELETTTDAAGHYSFAVRASDANGYTATFEIPDSLAGYEFTGTRVGDDRGIDSDADGQGAAEPVIVGADASNLTVDAGIVKPEIDLVKSATPTSGLDEGDTVTYTFTTTNTGQTVLHDVVLAEQVFTNADGTELVLDAPPALDTDASTGTPEELAPGEKLVWTATYTITPEDIGGPIVNDAKTTGVSPRDNEVSDEDSHTVTPKGVGAYTFSKVANVESGAEVMPGDTIEYTVKVQHDGEGKVDGATVTDDLSKVLDDAEYNGDVTASAGNVSVDGSKLTWTGDLAGGAEVTITYSVTVKPGGDELLHNVVTSDDKRGQCEDETGCETTHTMGEGIFVYSKTAEPKSGSTVRVGDRVAYTLTVEHRGDGSVENAVITDDLAEVLDDADYNGDIDASTGEARVKDGVLTWTGDLSHGETATITYSVTVQAGGDRTLTNGIVSEDPRGTCDPDRQCETTHDVPPGGGLAHTGAGSPVLWLGASGAALLAGAVLLLAQRRRRARIE